MLEQSLSSSLTQGLELLWQGMLGIFVVMLSIAGIVVLLTKIKSKD